MRSQFQVQRQLRNLEKLLQSAIRKNEALHRDIGSRHTIDDALSSVDTQINYLHQCVSNGVSEIISKIDSEGTEKNNDKVWQHNSSLLMSAYPVMAFLQAIGGVNTVSFENDVGTFLTSTLNPLPDDTSYWLQRWMNSSVFTGAQTWSSMVVDYVILRSRTASQSQSVLARTGKTISSLS